MKGFHVLYHLMPCDCVSQLQTAGLVSFFYPDSWSGLPTASSWQLTKKKLLSWPSHFHEQRRERNFSSALKKAHDLHASARTYRCHACWIWKTQQHMSTDEYKVVALSFECYIPTYLMYADFIPVLSQPNALNGSSFISYIAYCFFFCLFVCLFFFWGGAQLFSSAWLS